MAEANWLPLESDPEAFTEYLRDIGIKGVDCVDIFGFDDDCLNFVPKPCYAVVVCMPAGQKLNECFKKFAKDKQEGGDDVFFMKQKISNACGTFALFHSLANIRNRIDLGDGAFKKWLDEALKLDIEHRSGLLAKCEKLAKAHEKCAKTGVTSVQLGDKVESHFFCYVSVDNKLYEIDSSLPSPLLCCSTTEETFLNDVGKICRGYLTEFSSNDFFNAIALVQKV